MFKRTECFSVILLHTITIIILHTSIIQITTRELNKSNANHFNKLMLKKTSALVVVASEFESPTPTMSR